MKSSKQKKADCTNETVFAQKTQYKWNQKHPSLTPCDFMKDKAVVKRNQGSPWTFPCL